MLGRIGSTPTVQNKLSSKSVINNPEIYPLQTTDESSISLFLTGNDLAYARANRLPVSDNFGLEVSQVRQDGKPVFIARPEFYSQEKLVITPEQPAYEATKYLLEEALKSANRTHWKEAKYKNSDVLREMLKRSEI